MYVVRVEENARGEDDPSRWTLGEYADAETALSAARRVVDEDLESLYAPGMTPDLLYRHYTLFGHDPYILTEDPACRFSGWDYAQGRCREICRKGL